MKWVVGVPIQVDMMFGEYIFHHAQCVFIHALADLLGKVKFGS